MSVTICSRCLVRLQLPSRSSAALLTAPPSSTSTFHTSSPLYKSPLVRKPSGGTGKAKIAYRITSTPSYTGKRKKRSVPKLPAPGERRAARKRIVLSNTNALEIRDLDDLSTENMGDEAKVGQMLGLDGALLDQLRDAKAFKKSQNWALFRRPATLIREETVQLGQTFEKINAEQDGQKTVLRQIICGERMCGKSVLLLQAMSMAYMSRWIVIDVPDAVEHINNHHSYAPLSPQDQNGPNRQYIQPSLTADLLARLTYSNESVLKSLQPHNPPPKTIFPNPPPDLSQIAIYGVEHPSQSWPIFLYLMNELTADGRPPLIFAVDGLDHWMGPTQYRNSDHEIIHAHQFTLIQFFLKALFSDIPLPNGGIALAATTASNNPVYPTFNLLVQQIVALNRGIRPTSASFPLPPPYQKLDSRVSSLLDTATGANTSVEELRGLSKHETRGLLQYFYKSGLMKERVDETSLGEKWAMSGSGNVGELCKVGGRTRIDPEKMLGNIGTNIGIRMGQGEHIPKKNRD